MRYFIIGSFLLALMGMYACQNEPEMDSIDSNINEEHIIQVEDSEKPQNRDHTNQEAADRLSQIAAEVEEVEEANALVFGRYTIVGINVTDDLSRSRVGSVKYTVAEALKDDPYGHYAFVVAGGDIVARIQEINRGIREGEAQHVIVNEIANLVGRYIPETPPESNQAPSYEEQTNEQQTDEQQRHPQNPPQQETSS
ncbi:YhcN/YlaJ family sporulation lipoprotein [Alkalibacillus almallahensis]|uniref:YhcN/YlaJ family sporulation lipoprotein n=1 Tax=Alkalibacillus almallahensis TaxID=1379154 RepID=UPI00141F43EB|nr:YhcN/YlaJ family sporulation lipoprotein [Alkalibacillus almallahensis]NIK10651.1 YhcN/YlaJ family sporulation lipoprotein [Alkalibacillus almallahensis]